MGTSEKRRGKGESYLLVLLETLGSYGKFSGPSGSGKISPVGPLPLLRIVLVGTSATLPPVVPGRRPPATQAGEAATWHLQPDPT